MLTLWRNWFAPVQTQYYTNELQREIDSLFEGFEPGAFFRAWEQKSWPATELREEVDSYVLQTDVPGVTREDIEIRVENNILTLKGERKDEAPKGFKIFRKERGHFSFSKSYRLPAQVDASRAEAKLDKGVLTVLLPKTPEAQPKQIPILVA